MNIRKERQDDVEAIARLNDMAFLDSTEESSIIARLRGSGDLFLSLIAEVDGQIVGHIAFSTITIDGGPKSSEVFMGLAPMAVAPDNQRNGVGSALVKKGLDILKEQKVAAVFVLGHPEYYPKFGFRASQSSYGIKSIYEVPDNVFMALELKAGALNSVSGVARYCNAFGSSG